MEFRDIHLAWERIAEYQSSESGFFRAAFGALRQPDINQH